MPNKATVTPFMCNGVVMYRANIWDAKGRYSTFTENTEAGAWSQITGGAA